MGWGTDRPLAIKGLTSYRYRGSFGWIMIGARNDADALREAKRSLTLSRENEPTIENLEVWDGKHYVPCKK